MSGKAAFKNAIGVFAAECGSALLIKTNPHPCNPPEAFISIEDLTPTEINLFYSSLVEVGVYCDEIKADTSKFPCLKCMYQRGRRQL